jgi:hypothetical protein
LSSTSRIFALGEVGERGFVDRGAGSHLVMRGDQQHNSSVGAPT